MAYLCTKLSCYIYRLIILYLAQNLLGDKQCLSCQAKLVINRVVADGLISQAIDMKIVVCSN